MRLYEPPAKEFFRLPNSIFHVPLDATQFKLYAYLVCCSGSKGYCWPTHKKIIQDNHLRVINCAGQACFESPQSMKRDFQPSKNCTAVTKEDALAAQKLRRNRQR